MTKDNIIKAAIQIIQEEATKRGIEVINKGTGHAFDKSFWKGIAEDKSNIPNVIANNYDYEHSAGYCIELRSFWGSPEIDIREDGDLIVINFSDSVKEGTEFKHTEDFRVHEVRVDSYDYEKRLDEAKAIIKRVSESEGEV